MNQRPTLKILDVCKTYVVVNKPVGVFSQPPDMVKWRRIHGESHPPLLLDMVRSCMQQNELGCDELKTVHRLDTNVTGGVLIARDRNAAALFSRNLKKGGNSGHKLVRKYVALVEGTAQDVANEGVLEFAGMKSWFRKIDSGALVLQLCTGRKHQIRRQLAEGLGHPILNDVKYGARPIASAKHQIGLHSALIHTQVGLKKKNHLVPVDSGRDSLWSAYVDEAGNFSYAVQKMLIEDWGVE
ncbi:LAFA_0G08372g1_1 [Lachancea sp. 'fantastica']|nr:LAFA_0G08372g1_1 [Lachancea sp. 'fantastica']